MRHTARGAVLLEVILSLALFVATSGVVLGSLSACVRAAQTIRLEAEGADLAVTQLSQIQMGLLPLQDAGPETCDPPWDAWSWQVSVTSVLDNGEDMGLKKVEVAVTQVDQGFTYRLTALVADPSQASPATTDTSGAAATGGGT